MAFGFTFTLPTIAGSHSDFPVLLKTTDFPASAIDGSTDALANGGGDLVAYTDSGKGTQLAVNVVRFVSSGSPNAEVWVKIPTAATSSTIFIEASASQTSQPAVTATYGRDNVWSDYLAVLHLVESGNGTSGEYIDSTGNSYNGTGGGGTSSRAPSQVTTDHPWGGVWNSFDGSDDYIDIPTGSALDSSYISVQAMVVIDNLGSVDEGLISNRWSTQGNNFFQITPRASLGTAYLVQDGTGENTDRGGTTTTGVDYWSALTTESGAIRGIRNGSEDAVDTSISGDNKFSTTLNTRVGTYFDGSADRSLNAKIGEVRLRLGTLTAAWYLVEYNNQSATSAWGTLSAWADAGGGGSTVLMTISESIISADTSLSKAGFISTLSESISVVDTSAGKLSALLSVSESAGASDFDAGQYATSQEVIEAVEANDLSSALFKAILTQNINVIASDAVSIKASFGVTLNESLSGVDNDTGKVSFIATLSESIVGVDAASIVSSAITATIGEVIASADGVSMKANFIMTLGESVNVSDIQSSQASLISTINEAITSNDAFNAVSVYTLTIGEALTALDALSNALGSIKGFITATITINPLINIETSINPIITGTITVT